MSMSMKIVDKSAIGAVEADGDEEIVGDTTTTTTTTTRKVCDASNVNVKKDNLVVQNKSISRNIHLKNDQDYDKLDKLRSRTVSTTPMGHKKNDQDFRDQDRDQDDEESDANAIARINEQELVDDGAGAGAGHEGGNINLNIDDDGKESTKKKNNNNSSSFSSTSQNQNQNQNVSSNDNTNNNVNCMDRSAGSEDKVRRLINLSGGSIGGVDDVFIENDGPGGPGGPGGGQGGEKNVKNNPTLKKQQMAFSSSSGDSLHQDLFDKAKMKIPESSDDPPATAIPGDSSPNSPLQSIIRWPDFKPNIIDELWLQLTDETLVDCTLVCGPTESIRVHQIILSANSPYFKSILSCYSSPNHPYPIVILQDVNFKILQKLVTFMYRGEIRVDSSEMDILLKTAESLQISGLSQLNLSGQKCNNNNTQNSSQATTPTTPTTTSTSIPPIIETSRKSSTTPLDDHQQQQLDTTANINYSTSSKTTAMMSENIIDTTVDESLHHHHHHHHHRVKSQNYRDRVESSIPTKRIRGYHHGTDHHRSSSSININTLVDDEHEHLSLVTKRSSIPIHPDRDRERDRDERSSSWTPHFSTRSLSNVNSRVGTPIDDNSNDSYSDHVHNLSMSNPASRRPSSSMGLVHPSSQQQQHQQQQQQHPQQQQNLSHHQQQIVQQQPLSFTGIGLGGLGGGSHSSSINISTPVPVGQGGQSSSSVYSKKSRILFNQGENSRNSSTSSIYYHSSSASAGAGGHHQINPIELSVVGGGGEMKTGNNEQNLRRSIENRSWGSRDRDRDNLSDEHSAMHGRPNFIDEQLMIGSSHSSELMIQKTSGLKRGHGHYSHQQHGGERDIREIRERHGSASGLGSTSQILLIDHQQQKSKSSGQQHQHHYSGGSSSGLGGGLLMTTAELQQQQQQQQKQQNKESGDCDNLKQVDCDNSSSNLMDGQFCWTSAASAAVADHHDGGGGGSGGKRSRKSSSASGYRSSSGSSTIQQHQQQQQLLSGGQGQGQPSSILCLRYCCIYCSQNFPSQPILERHIVSYHHQINIGSAPGGIPAAVAVGGGSSSGILNTTVPTPTSVYPIVTTVASSLQLRQLPLKSKLESSAPGDSQQQQQEMVLFHQHSTSPPETPSSKMGRLSQTTTSSSMDSSKSHRISGNMKIEPSPGSSASAGDYEEVLGDHHRDTDDSLSAQNLPSPPPGSSSSGGYGQQLQQQQQQQQQQGSPPSEILCKFCSKPFPEVSLLIQHLPIHTGERPFKCEYCGKAFKLRHHMKDHARVHTGERPFKCQLCGKTFSRSTILKAHEKTHFPKT